MESSAEFQFPQEQVNFNEDLDIYVLDRDVEKVVNIGLRRWICI
jgi:hypothetical protein